MVGVERDGGWLPVCMEAPGWGHGRKVCLETCTFLFLPSLILKIFPHFFFFLAFEMSFFILPSQAKTSHH